MQNKGLEASVSSLDKEEKNELLRKLNAGRQEDENGADDEDGEQRGENIFERLEKRDAAKRAQKAAQESASLASFTEAAGEFLQKMIDYLRSIFGGEGGKKSFAQKKELKEMEKSLASFHFSVYDSKLGVVRKAFMVYLADIHSKIESFCEFFTRNFRVGSEEFIYERAPSFARFVIEAQFSADQTRILRELRNFDMPKNFSTRGEAPVQREIEIKLSKFVDSFAGSASRRIDEALDFYNSIVNLRNYNFLAVFSLFRAGDAPDAAFKDFALEYCVEQLRNLDSYFARIDFSNLREDHYNWFDRFHELYPAEPDAPRYCADDFRGLVSILRKLCGRDVVGILVRIGSENASYHAKPVSTASSWVDDYRRLAESSIKAKLERCIISFREEQIQFQVSDLFDGYHAFGWHPVLNRETNIGLQHAGGPEMTNAFTYNILWNYMEYVYIERYKRTVNTIVVEGEFRKKEMATEFTNNYYELDGHYEYMKGMNERLDQNSPLAQRLNMYIAGNMENALAIKTFADELLLLNGEITKITQQCGLCLMNMNKIMEKIVFDFKSLQTGDLINARTIGGVSNRNLLAVYDKFSQSLKKLETVISGFIVVSDQIQNPGRK